MPAALMVVGLGNGDEGKGAVVDHLVRRHGISRVVRFNGGAQALHHVVCEGRVHGFSQFSAGTFAGAETLLSRFMLFEPLAFCREAHALAALGIPDPFAHVSVSANAPVITPLNVLTNQVQELHRGKARHGSCGMGIGLTQGDVEELGDGALYAGDLSHPALVREKLAILRARRLSDAASAAGEETRELIQRLTELDLEDLALFYGELAERLRIVTEEQVWESISGHDLVFEGAQGVLLDQHLGFFPHVTRSNTTFENAETLLREAGCAGLGTRIGLLRGYATRHGAGPLPTETAELKPRPCDNGPNAWQGAFRSGWFDAVSARYALEVCGGVDLLGLTNLDRLAGCGGLKAAVRYQPVGYFASGTIPRVAPEPELLRKRTEKVLHACPEYTPLPSIQSSSPEELFRYAGAVSELLHQEVGLISARPDHHMLYRGAASLTG